MTIKRQHLDPDKADVVLKMFNIIEAVAVHSGRYAHISAAAAAHLNDLDNEIAEAGKAERKKELEAQAHEEVKRQDEVRRKADENLKLAKENAAKTEEDRLKAEAKAQAEAQVPAAGTKVIYREPTGGAVAEPVDHTRVATEEEQAERDGVTVEPKPEPRPGVIPRRNITNGDSSNV